MARRHRVLHGLTTLTVLAGAAVLPLGAAGAATAGAAAADAARASDGCVAQIKVPNVGIHRSSPGMFQQIQGTLVQSCGAADAKWDANYGSQTEGSWEFAGTTTAYWPLPYGSGPIGHYQVVPAGAVDAAGNPVRQAATSFIVKFSSRVHISGYRSGGYVYVRARVLRFNWDLRSGYGAWQPSPHRGVSFYDWRNGAWSYRGSEASGTNGWTPYLRIHAPTRRSFYAHVTQTTSLWGARSPILSR